MRHLPLVVVAVSIAACGGDRVLVSSPGPRATTTSNGGNGGGAGGAAGGAGASVVEVAPPNVEVTPTVDAAVSTIVPMDPLADAGISAEAAPSAPDAAPPTEAGAFDAGGDALPSTCADLAAGGAPDTLVDFQWEWDPGCDGGMCWTTVRIEAGCTLRRVGGPPAKQKTEAATMPASVCQAARGWVTNARFLDVLRAGAGCSGGTLPEAFELTLTTEQPRWKTWGCDEPTVALERSCLRALLDQSFP